MPLVRIFASFDMGWTQRGNGRTYDSLNGYSALIGSQTGKILDYCTRNRKCKICDVGRRTGVVKEHDCRLNFYGSAKAMEADAAVQLVTDSKILKDIQVEVGVFIGDNDSSCISAIQAVTKHEVLKQSDMNHSTKGIGNLLYEIHKNKEFDPNNELSSEIIKHVQRCFSYAVHQNKGDVGKIKTAIVNIPFHLFDYHEDCGTWCKANEDKENTSGVRLQNPVLFEQLKKLFIQISENAVKFASAASSQSNESLNNMMCSKAPKRICYSLSESSDYRFAATVAQKNCGTDYLIRCMDVAGMSWNNTLQKYIQHSEKITLKTRERFSKPSYKRKRLQLKAQRSQLRNRKERTEGDTYKSNMNLLDNALSGIDDCIQITTENVVNYETDHVNIVFFDLETGGLKFVDEILQIAMKSGRNLFNAFITPTRSISHAASKANGLTTVQKKLFQHGKEVNTFPSRQVLLKVLEYLRNLGKKCILVAHNCPFDSTRFILAIQKLSLLEEFEACIEGFSDTLPLFRQKFLKRQNGYKLTTLASELLSLPCDGAHDAGFDVNLLEKLTLVYIDINDIIKSKKSINEVLLNMQKNENIKQQVLSYQPMKSVISVSMQKKLASFGITYELLIHTFKTKGLEEVKSLLQGGINGSPKIITTKKILNNILDYLISEP